MKRFLPVLIALVLIFPISALTLDETLNTLIQAGSATGKNAEFSWDPFFQSGVFSMGGHYASFISAQGPDETGYLLLNRKDLYTVPLPYIDKGQLFFPETFTASLKNAFNRAIEEETSRFHIAAIIVDPGHGGKDSGALSPLEYSINGKPGKINEKDVALTVSKRLASVLREVYPDKLILMTRDRDVSISLTERTSLANSVSLKDNEAIIFISIHANASLNTGAQGYEVWYLPPEYRRDLLDPSKFADSSDIRSILNDMLQEEYTTESILMGKSILSAFGETFGAAVPNRGLKAKDWYVVRNSRMPAVLVELGFLSNQDDVLLMTGEKGLQKYTEALYKGIADFINAFERSGGFTAVQ